MLSRSLVSQGVLLVLEPLDPFCTMVGDWVLAPPPPWPPLSFATLGLQRRLLSSVSHLQVVSISVTTYYDESLFLLGHSVL